jgi:plasmid stabilization system protein ParE
MVVLKPVEFHPEAMAEGDDAISWYAERNRRVALQFVQEIEEAIGKISEAPHR